MTQMLEVAEATRRILSDGEVAELERLVMEPLTAETARYAVHHSIPVLDDLLGPVTLMECSPGDQTLALSDLFGPVVVRMQDLRVGDDLAHSLCRDSPPCDDDGEIDY